MEKQLNGLLSVNVLNCNGSEAANYNPDDHINLARKRAHYFYRKCSYGKISLDDLINSGYLGLVKASERFNPKRNIKFSTYAMFWVDNYIITTLKSLNIKNLSDFNLKNIPIYDKKQNEDNEILNMLLEILDYEEKYIINAIYFDNKKLYMIGKELNYSGERIRQIRNIALKKLSRYSRRLNLC